jgi:hypothetical protein
MMAAILDAILLISQLMAVTAHCPLPPPLDYNTLPKIGFVNIAHNT